MIDFDGAVAVEVVFPEGYTEVEHLPRPYAVRSPLDADETWYEFRSETRMEGGRLVVRLVRERHRRGAAVLGPELFALVRDWDRVCAGKAGRTVSVRRPKSAAEPPRPDAK